MVSKSEAWEQIAEELRLPLARKKARGTRMTPRTGRIGEEIALERQGVADVSRNDPAATMMLAEREETLRMIRKLPNSQAKRILDKYENGEITDDQAREQVRALLSQE
jgi:hypothetical protein